VDTKRKAARYRGNWWRNAYEEADWKLFEDFRYFLCLVWDYLNLPSPTKIQLDIAHWLQHGPRRKIIEAFRGVGKSWICSALVVWLLLRDPQLKILVVSASKERADQFSTFALRLINEMPICAHLIPEEHQRQSKIAFDVGPALPDHSPSVKSVGILGQLTGSRANRIVADDVEVPNNSETQGMREKLGERVKEFDAVLKPGGSVDYLGTPQTEESLYNELPRRGYTIRVWPARFPKLEEIGLVYRETLAPIIVQAVERDAGMVGRPTDRFDDEDLQERELSYGRSGFALQFMLDTRLSDQDRYPLKLADLVVMSLNPELAPEKVVWSGNPEFVLKDLECVGLSGDRYYRPAVTFGDWIPYTASLLYIDPSGRGKDETGYAVLKMLNGYLYLVAAGGFRDGYSEATLRGLAMIARDHNVNLVKIESNFGDAMFTQLIRPHLAKYHPCAIEEERVARQKELRIIETLEPVMNAHRLVVDRRVIEQDRLSTKGLPQDKALRYQLFYQLSRMTREKGALAQDDRIEALAGAVRHFQGVMAQDVDAKMHEREEEMRRQQLELAYGLNWSPDSFAFGLTIEQARKVQVGGQQRRLDMVL